MKASLGRGQEKAMNGTEPRPGRARGRLSPQSSTASRDSERAGPRSASAAGLRGHWLPPPSITAPPPIATRGSAGLTAGALGPAWANRVGEGGRRPRRAAKKGGPRWRRWGGSVDTALPVPRPRALSAAAPSSARDRGPLSPHGDGAGMRERPAGCGAPASPSSFPPARSPSRDPGAGEAWGPRKHPEAWSSARVQLHSQRTFACHS
ncbi:serine/arginine repetitive matrix protein 3-like [Passer montanus]|uniref:serine/arginine repetitive matrix protein 3-like n=1 Tax=Passer montanus TaxID=9160 RepID=UPI0019602DC9|nr:serine/arginine repetitive matrix protein 3-like [Passer montanus]